MVNRRSKKRGSCSGRRYDDDDQGHNHRGGAIRMPSEYFGGVSGRYGVDANAGRCPSAYGYTNAQSFGGNLPGNQVGPNMFAHPDGSGLQTGGRNRKGKKGRKSNKRSNSCPKKRGACPRKKRSANSKSRKNSKSKNSKRKNRRN